MTQRRKILFVCIGNAIRSQMAEAFAKHLGPDIIDPLSAGLYPAGHIPPFTTEVMKEKGIALDGQYSKSLYEVPLNDVHRIINMSGEPLLGPLQRLAIDWPVDDPIGRPIAAYRKARDTIEQRMVDLIHSLRANP